MTLYIGIDFHPYQQTIAFCDSNDGQIKYRQFLHSDKEAIRRFYRECGKDSVLGLEATGALQWFQKMLSELGLKLLVGNPRLIRRMALSKHKNDFRDAENILDLLINERFPEVKIRTEESTRVLQLIQLRHSFVGQRTRIANQLQAFARQKGLAKFQTKAKTAKARILSSTENESERFLVNSRFHLFEELNAEIQKLEAELTKKAAESEEVKLLLTHPGVGELTALSIVHTLGDVRRFRRKEEVVSFVGLDPLDKSSGARRRIGEVSKHGSPVLRFLLMQAGQTSGDKRLKAFYARVSRRRGKAKAKVALGRKRLINNYVMLRDRIDYQEFCRRGEVGLCE